MAITHDHAWNHTNAGTLGTSLWRCQCGATYDGAKIVQPAPAPATAAMPATEVADLWFFAHGVTSTTMAYDEPGRNLLRGWFFRGLDGDEAFEVDRALKSARAGGFLVDTFLDEGDRAIIIDADKVPLSALPEHLRA